MFLHQRALACNHRGYVYLLQGKLDKARADLNKAVELNDKLIVAYRNRSIVYGRLGERDKALADLTTASLLALKEGANDF